MLTNSAGQPEEVYHLTFADAILCGDCMKDKDAIRVADDLVVVIEKDRLVERRVSWPNIPIRSLSGQSPKWVIDSEWLIVERMYC